MDILIIITAFILYLLSLPICGMMIDERRLDCGILTLFLIPIILSVWLGFAYNNMTVKRVTVYDVQDINGVGIINYNGNIININQRLDSQPKKVEITEYNAWSCGIYICISKMKTNIKALE